MKRFWERMVKKDAVKDAPVRMEKLDMRKFYQPRRGARDNGMTITIMTTYRTQQDAAFSVTKFLKDSRPILTIEKRKGKIRTKTENIYKYIRKLIIKNKREYFFTHISNQLKRPVFFDSGS